MMLRRTFRGASIALVLIGVIAVGAAQALVVTPLDTESNVSGSIVGSSGNWSDSQQTLDFEFIEVAESFGQLAVRSQVNSSYTPALQRFSVQTGQSTTLGFSMSDTTALDYDHIVRFTIDESANFVFENTQAITGFPRAIPGGDSATASLTYELEAEGGGSVFLYVAPNLSSGEAGPYASGMIPAGTYALRVIGSASLAPNACCANQTATISGNVSLSLTEVPAPVPVLGGFPLAVLGLSLALLSIRFAARERGGQGS